MAETSGFLTEGDHPRPLDWGEKMTDKEELKPCPLGLDTHHNPYIVSYDEKEGELICPTAYIECACGLRSPMRFGDKAVKEAIKAWNTRAVPEGYVKKDRLKVVVDEDKLIKFFCGYYHCSDCNDNQYPECEMAFKNRCPQITNPAKAISQSDAFRIEEN